MQIAELKQRFDADGFLKIEPFFPEDQMREIESELDRFLQELTPSLRNGDIVYETDSKSGERVGIRNLFRMEEYSDYFAKLTRDPKLLELVGPLVNGRPVSTGVELFAKPARVGSAVPYHQDNGYFNWTPPDALTFWLALDDSSVENGCVYYARGSHRRGLRQHKASLVPGNSWGLARYPEPGELDEVPGLLRRGGAILHHCLTLHRSERNLSARPRRGLLMVYRGEHCRIDPVGYAAYQAAFRALQDHLAAQAQSSKRGTESNQTTTA